MLYFTKRFTHGENELKNRLNFQTCTLNIVWYVCKSMEISLFTQGYEIFFFFCLFYPGKSVCSLTYSIEFRFKLKILNLYIWQNPFWSVCLFSLDSPFEEWLGDEIIRNVRDFIYIYINASKRKHTEKHNWAKSIIPLAVMLKNKLAFINEMIAQRRFVAWRRCMYVCFASLECFFFLLFVAATQTPNEMSVKCV